MNTNKIAQAIAAIANETDAEPNEIISALVGLCWDEEDGGEIEREFEK